MIRWVLHLLVEFALQKLTLDRLQEFTESYPHLALMLNSAAAKPEPTA